MKKVLHIFFLCLMSLVALVANAQITSVSELNNTTTYTLKTTERGYFLYNEATSTEALTSSYNLDGGQNATPTGEASQQFAFLRGTNTPEGKYYLYSVGAGKFVGFNTSDVKTYLKDAPTTADRVTLTASGSNFVLADATGRKVNISTWQAYLGVKVFDCDADGGNLLVVTAVNTEADFSAALALIEELEAPDPEPEPEPEPIEDYYVCFDKAATHNTWGGTKTDRDVAKVSLNSPTFGLQEINTTNAHNVYNDMTSAEGFKVAPGETVVPAIGYTGSWMHGYVYVDLDQSKQFEVESIDAAELVTYNYYNGVNKAGASASVNVAFGTPFPAFTAPSEPGTYRIRFKVDWESYEPAGAAGANGNGTGSQGIVANGGSVIDALMIVAEPPSVKYNVTFTYKQNGTVIGTTSQDVYEGEPVPAFSVPSYVETSVEGTLPETVTENLNIVVNTTVKADCPFKMYASTDAEDVVWTALTLKRSPVLYLYATEDGTQISNTAVETLPTDETLKKYAWCFVGDWLNGFTINNLATGKRIASPSTALTDGTDYHAILTDATLEDGTDKFTLVTNAAGNYFIKRADTDTYFLSNNGGVNNTLLSFWNSGNALTDGGTGDGGSIFEVVAITLPEPVLNTLVPTVEPTTATGTLETITLNFEKEVTYDNTKTITLGNRMMGITKDITVAVSAEDAKVVTITLAEPVTEPGFLSLYIPEETFTATEDGSFNPELTSPITVLAPTNSFAFESTTPADNARLLELSTVKVTYAEGPTLATEGASVEVINAATSTAVTTATVGYDAEDWNSVVFTLAEAITTPGTYTLSIPDEFIWNSQYNEGAEDKGVSMGAIYTPATTLTFTVVDAYPVNFDKDMNRTRYDRTLNSVTLTEEGQAGQTVRPANTSKIYNDQHETAVLTCTVGSTLTATFNYSGTWMHGYVYIDTENDYAFSFNEGSTDQSGTDLKTFAFYSGNFNNDKSGYNSAGEYITGDARSTINPPSFTAPTTPGTYRIRFKVDWNSVDPGGQKAADGTVTSQNGIAANAGYIVDATLVVNPLAPIAPASVTPADQDIVESFTAATITFEGNVTCDSEKEITIGQRGGMYYATATVNVDGNTVTVTAPAEITEPGYYTITVPEGAFSNAEGRINEAFSTSFVILAPANTFEYTSVSPENKSTQTSLDVITLSYAPEWVGWVNATPINVLNTEGTAVGIATLSMSETDNTDALLTLSATLTANGTYTIAVPEGYIYDNNYDETAEDKGVSMGGATYNPAFTLTFTVSQSTGIGSVSIDRNAGKTIFSIDGRKVSGKLQRGAYIIDGQKKFVK